jgi:hypothetical protein
VSQAVTVNRGAENLNTYIAVRSLNRLRRSAQGAAIVNDEGPESWVKSDENIGAIVRVQKPAIDGRIRA